MQTVTEQTNSLSAKLNRVVWCHDFKTFTKINFGKVLCKHVEMKRENLSRKTVSSVAHNVLQICDGRAFELKCSLGKRILQPLKSRQTETNCTPIANVLLQAVHRPLSVLYLVAVSLSPNLSAKSDIFIAISFLVLSYSNVSMSTPIENIL
jgi:hypothetical protein